VGPNVGVKASGGVRTREDADKMVAAGASRVGASAYCFPRLTELEVLTSASLKYAIAERGYRLGSYLDV
ncbi:hypothetical protein ACUOA8_22795, partial [Escherichia sp. SS-MK2]